MHLRLHRHAPAHTRRHPGRLHLRQLLPLHRTFFWFRVSFSRRRFFYLSRHFAQVGEVHVINCAPLVAKIFKRALHTVVPKHIADQVQIHVRATEILRSVRTHHLPKQIGGDADCAVLEPPDPPPPNGASGTKAKAAPSDDDDGKTQQQIPRPGDDSPPDDDADDDPAATAAAPPAEEKSP
mmetsp:Transcript_10590/g.35002  ORF Transcript_10590/g.35002 Transcript_10590/m.35002 type:complete len:181 (-) Transcript_10590:191-733(-)